MERGRATERAGTGPADSGPGGLAARLYRQAWLMFVLPPLFWSGNFVLGKAVAGHVPPVGLAFWRWTGALLILLVLFGPRFRADLPELRRRWPIVLVLAALGIGLYNTLVYIGLGTTSVLNALVLQSSTPVVIVAASVLVYRDRIGLRQAAGIAVSLAGALAIVTRGDPAALLDLRLAIGDALILLAVAGYALYTVLLRDRPAVHPMSLLIATFGLGAAMILPFYLHESLVAGRPMPLDGTTAWAVAYVCVFPSILAYIAFNRSVELLGANRTGLAFHLMPVFGSLLAILLLGERFEGHHAVGIPLIAAGILLATRQPAARP
jgi:drug/metabolite transporter (DMT)-like permease